MSGSGEFQHLPRRGVYHPRPEPTEIAARVSGGRLEAREQNGAFEKRLENGQALLRRLGLTSDGQDKPLDAKASGLKLAVRPGAKRVTVVFSGNTRVFATPPPLVEEQESHVILLRDPKRCFGLLGIPGLGKDYETCVASLRAIITALNVQESYCIGISAGGSAALKFGCDLGVSGILGFSVPTTLNLDDDKGAELKDYPQLTLLYKHARHLGIDLAKYYSASSPRPSAILVYGEQHPRDAWLAERMGDLTGVKLVTTEGFGGHTTYKWATEHGQLSPLIENLFDLQPVVLTH